MSRVLSAARIKGRYQCGVARSAPAGGTAIRRVYDMFMANRGRPVDTTFGRADRVAIIYLVDNYGLDIRCLRYGQWVLAGEWFGRVYVDYIAEQMDAPAHEAGEAA